jgi:ABC-type nitrate/sulfonate/bicarbonate transport system substrate-binding protein
MVAPSPPSPSTASARPIHLGFVAAADCAPLIVARDLGLFRKHGLDVRLSREAGWATVRDKIYAGELDAAQAVTGVALVLGLGLGGLSREVSVPLMLNAHGNALTLGESLPHKAIGLGEGLASFLEHRWRRSQLCTFAVGHRYSSHHILLQAWLQQHGLHGHPQLQIIFLPPPLMAGNLKAGHIDGYCAAEPWNSQAILGGYGWVVATSAEIASHHPEKVLIVTSDLQRHRPAEVISLTAALLEACRICQDPAFREDLIIMLAKPQATGVSPALLRNSLGPIFRSGRGDLDASSFHLFHGSDLNCPSTDKASWFLAGLRYSGLLPDSAVGNITRIFRTDIFQAAEHALQ